MDVSALAEHRQNITRIYGPVEPCPLQDELTRWQQTIGDLAENLPKEKRRTVMNHLYNLLL